MINIITTTFAENEEAKEVTGVITGKDGEWDFKFKHGEPMADYYIAVIEALDELVLVIERNKRSNEQG